MSEINLGEGAWDRLNKCRRLALEHPEGMIDLSIGSPVDSTPRLLGEILARSANAPGYPSAEGSLELRQELAGFLERDRLARFFGEEGVLPTIGAKEIIGFLPSFLGLGPDDAVVIPPTAYPTYAVGARWARCKLVFADDPADWPPNARLVWICSPSNPTGRVMSKAGLRSILVEARRRGIIVASDECYSAFVWEGPYAGSGAPSLLDYEVCGADYANLFLVHSFSKSVSAAGYRLAFIAGDKSLIARILKLRKHLGLVVPGPVQAVLSEVARRAAEITGEVRARYAPRRRVLERFCRAADFEICTGAGGLYLWARPRGLGRDLVWLAKRGILAAPGSMYGVAGEGFIRLAMTCSDEKLSRLIVRLG